MSWDENKHPRDDDGKFTNSQQAVMDSIEEDAEEETYVSIDDEEILNKVFELFKEKLIILFRKYYYQKIIIVPNY